MPLEGLTHILCSIRMRSLCRVCVRLSIRHKEIRSEKLVKKAKKVVLQITGSAGFNPDAEIDLGPLEFQKKSVNTKKSTLKIKAIVPAGREPGSIQISVGDYIGWIQVR